MTQASSTTAGSAMIKQDGNANLWTCHNCGKPMGQLFRTKVHLHPPKSHIYHVKYPVTATCCRCGLRNRITSATSD